MDQPQTAGYGYALGGKIMLSAIVLLFVVVVFMSAFHLYARWYFLRLRRERRNRRRGVGTVIVYSDNAQPGVAANHGLEREVLNSLPFYAYCSKTADQSISECAVCLSEFEDEEVVRLLPKCGHSFHIQCIDMWFYSHSTCPLCRSPVEAAAVSDASAGVVEVAEKAGSSGEPSSSQSEPVQHEETNRRSCSDPATPSTGKRKGMGGSGTMELRIEVGPLTPRRLEPDSELSQSSPGTRFLYFKRLLSMNRRSPAGGSCGASPIAGTSSAATTEVDLEGGIRVAIHVQTPR